MSRNETAELPTDIDGSGWWAVLKRVKTELDDDQVGLIAAGIAFYGLLALFPAITAIVAIAGLVTEPSVLVENADRLAAALPQEAADIIIGQMEAVAGSREGGLGLAAFFGILIAIWSASKGVDNIMRGLNVAYDEEEKRGFIELKLRVLMLTLVVLIGFLTIIALMAVIPIVLEFVRGIPLAETLIIWGRWPLMFAIGVFGFMLLYRYGPSRENAEWAWLAPGALIGCALWVVATLGFALYVRTFGSYNETFGTLAGVVMLLMWLWITAYALLFGAELDAELEAQTSHDTTTGRDLPMGQRGAVKADTVKA
jgi:membrane protein